MELDVFHYNFTNLQYLLYKDKLNESTHYFLKYVYLLKIHILNINAENFAI